MSRAKAVFLIPVMGLNLTYFFHLMHVGLTGWWDAVPAVTLCVLGFLSVIED